VTEYRAYQIGDDGHFFSFDAFTCRDDGEAVQRARRLVGEHDVELWSGDRFVIKLPCPNKPTAKIKP
jgi:hypothetical protein